MKKTSEVILLLLMGCTILLSAIWIYFQKNLEPIDLGDPAKKYKRHYVMVADEKESALWNAIYESAVSEADKQDAYLEFLQPQDNPDFSIADCIQIAIASNVDGIILHPDGSENMTALINEATKANIPVVVVMDDDTVSSRISYVGLNSYQMSDAYTEQVMKLLKPEETEIMMLSDEQGWNASTRLTYSQMVRAIDQGKKPEQIVHMQEYKVDGLTEFNAEEAIRDIFVNGEKRPDIIICLGEVLTECTYQALVDYNEVGNIDIIGFYYSNQILEAVDRNIIAATIALDTTEIGKLAIDALDEYHSLGYASTYYSVGLDIITADNAASFLDKTKAQVNPS